MRDVKSEDPAAAALDRLLLAERPPRPAPDLSGAVMAAVREEARLVSGAGGFAKARPLAPPPPLSLGALWRPAAAIVGAFVVTVLALLLWSGTPSGERWLPLLGAAVENPLFRWVAGTLVASAAAIVVPMAWMEA